MCLWKFRIDIPGDPPDITVATAVLARYPARLLNMSLERGCQQATGEFVIDLPHDEGVGPILSALHDISPRVLIGREKACVASRPAAATDATATTAPVTTAPVAAVPVAAVPVAAVSVAAAPVSVAAGTATKTSAGQSATATRTRRAADHRVSASLRRVSRRRRPGWRA